VAVDNRQFTPTILREAVQATASTTKPLELLIKTGEYYETHRIDYHGGERYPHLVRDPPFRTCYPRFSSRWRNGRTLHWLPAPGKLSERLLMEGPVMQGGRVKVRSVGPH